MFVVKIQRLEGSHNLLHDCRTSIVQLARFPATFSCRSVACLSVVVGSNASLMQQAPIDPDPAAAPADP